MINILEQPQPIVNPRYRAIATFNGENHRSNVLATLMARDPYFNLGRILTYTHVDKPSSATSPKTKTATSVYSDDPRLQAVLTPGVIRVLQNFSVSSTVESLLNMTMTETHHVNQLTRQISASIVDGGITTLGLNLRNLVTMEGPLARPIPLSKILKPDSPLSFLTGYFDTHVRRGTFRFGAEPEVECPDTFTAVSFGPDSIKSTKNMLREFLDQLAGPPTAVALKIEPSKTGKGGYSVHVPAPVGTLHDTLSGVLDFLLAFKTDGPMLNQLDAIANVIPVDHLREYMTPQLIKLHQDNSASALIVTYYCMAPMMLRLKYLVDALEHPVFKLRLSEQKIDFMDHPRIKSAIDFIQKFSLPTLLASEYNQSKGVSYTFGKQEISDIITIEAATAEEFIYGKTSLAEQLRDTSANSIFSLLVDFDTLLDSEFLKRDRVLSVASSMAGPSFTTSGKIVLRANSNQHLNVTDSHRSTLAATNLFGTCRQLTVTLSQDNKADPNLREIQSRVLGLQLSGPKFSSFTEVGFAEASDYCIFVRRAYLHEQMLQRATSSGAHSLAPFPAVGMPGPDDAIIRIDGPEELANQLGFFGRADLLSDLPFALRFDPSEPFYALKGPLAAKFIYSSLLQLVSCYNHWRLGAVDALIGSSLDLSVDDVIRLVCVPAPDKAVLRLASAKNVNFDAEIASVFGQRAD
jgi:hypothetical protein